VLALAKDAQPTAHHVEVGPPTSEHFGATEPGALHENDRGTLIGKSGLADSAELVEAGTVDVRTSLLRPSNLG
jgi:hypothetical protein